MNRGEIFLKNESRALLPSYLISRGIPLPVGAVRNPDGVTIRNSAGKVLPFEGKVLQKRPDGSIEWLLMDVVLDLGDQEKTSIFIEPKASTTKAKMVNPVTVTDNGQEVTLANKLTSVTVSRAGGSLIRGLTIQGKKLIDDKSGVVDLQTVDGSSKIHRASLAGAYRVTVTHQNRLHATVTVEGKHQARDGSTFLDFALRFTLSANCPDLKLEHTFYCREKREGKIAVNAIRLVIPTNMDPGASKLLRQAHHGHGWFSRPMEIAENLEIVASSVADIDNYRQGAKGPGVSHPCAGGQLFIRNQDSLHEDYSEYPFHMRPGAGSGFRADLQISGLRGVYPYIGWKEKGFTLTTAFERWRQLHPKSINLDENLMTVNIWPEWSTPLQLVQGVSKSHILWITGQPRELSVDEIELQSLRWEVGSLDPVDFHFDPAWPAHCQALECHQLLAYQPDKYPMLENLIEPVPSAGNPNRFTYDRHPAQGMLHFGDNVSPDASSCTNNEDDIMVLYPLQDYLRSGRTYCFDYGKEAARHYMEVDFCEFSTDPRQVNGLIPHTGSHFIGNVYPSHQWSEGILAYYYLTGDERARHVVISVGDNSCYWADNLLEWICCDGREAGMPLVNLAAAFRLTQDKKYLAAARKIIANFHAKWFKIYGDLRYPYPQGMYQKVISGYGDWSSYAGMYRIWEVSGDKEVRKLLLALLEKAIAPENFSLNDARGMDFFAAWIYGQLTGDEEEMMRRCQRAVPMLLRRGGHPVRRLHFLKALDERGLLDERLVGNRAGVI